MCITKMQVVYNTSVYLIPKNWDTQGLGSFLGQLLLGGKSSEVFDVRLGEVICSSL